jgi:Tfp pilus assembly protein PilX
MTRARIPNRRPAALRAQRGIVLFIALIVMVALSLAGVALVRSVETTGSVTGNLAFRQSALLQANWAVEDAIGHVYKLDTSLDPSSLIDTTTTDNSVFYSAVFDPTKDSTKAAQPGLPSGVPDLLWKKSALPAAYTDTASGNEVRYFIQRMCTSAAEGATANQAQCDLMQPKQALGTTVGDEAISVGKFPLYRVTVRVDGPNNSLAFIQAMIRG